MEIEVPIQRESQDRYLTYALSVVSERALPDVRDGLKPVQRRILYAMYENLGLLPDRPPRKSAAVVGEVLARYHPHGDAACYEAMVRMAQDFSLRYPLIDGQGNFGSMDGDSAAAYRYTEARLRPMALEVIGEIRQETVNFKDNFDSTVKEPDVLASRIPNLLVNGASGIAVGMATNIPPHNLSDVIRALIAISEDESISNSKLTSIIKGPDFPTGCLILNTKKELEEIYATGRGSIRMRGEWSLESGAKGKNYIVVSSVPFAVNKAQLVEKIASLIIDKKIPQLVDIRDESTDDVRIVIELASGADAEAAMIYIFKHTPLESIFAVNLTALILGDNQSLRPAQLNLRNCLLSFLDFRYQIVERRLQFELKNLESRIHILEGLATVLADLDEAIKIVRASNGRRDAADKLVARYELTDVQSLAVVDMRIYQLSKTNVKDIKDELSAKLKRVREIKKTLNSKAEILGLVRADLAEVLEVFGDRRRCRIDSKVEDLELNDEDYLVNEDVYALITKDGWVKRIRQTNDYSSARLREGDSLMQVLPASTLDYIIFITSQGISYSLRVVELPSSSGFGTPIQRLLKFKDGETIICSYVYSSTKKQDPLVLEDGCRLFAVSEFGSGSCFDFVDFVPTKRNGKRMVKVRNDDRLAYVGKVTPNILLLSELGQVLKLAPTELPVAKGPSFGVSLMSLNEKKGDRIVAATGLDSPKAKIKILHSSQKEKELDISAIEFSKRGTKGTKIISAGTILGIKT